MVDENYTYISATNLKFKSRKNSNKHFLQYEFKSDLVCKDLLFQVGSSRL